MLYPACQYAVRVRVADDREASFKTKMTHESLFSPGQIALYGQRFRRDGQVPGTVRIRISTSKQQCYRIR